MVQVRVFTWLSGTDPAQHLKVSLAPRERTGFPQVYSAIVEPQDKEIVRYLIKRHMETVSWRS